LGRRANESGNRITLSAAAKTSQAGSRKSDGPSLIRPSRNKPTSLSRDSILGYLLIAPILLVLVLTIAFPLVSAVISGFQDQRIIGTSSSFVGFETYLKVINDGSFWDSLGRSGLWVVVNLVVQTILAFCVAFSLQQRGRWSKSARTWVVLPWVIPTVAVSVIWQWLLNSNYGVLHYLLGEIGINLGSPFGEPSTALFAVILVNSWHWFPLGAVVIYGALSTVPVDVIEAARMDGAGAGRIFWSITFPILQPVLFALGLVGSLWSFNILDSIYLITAGGPIEATTTAPVFVYDLAFSEFRSSQAAAASVLTALVLGAAALLFVRFGRPKENV
jgi:multiple sugar transport system permease protein